MRKNVLMIFAVLFLSVSAFAQDSLKMELSLSDAKTYALEHNRSLQNASLAVKKAHAARWQTIASMLPQVNAAFDYSNFCGYEMKFSGMPIPMNPSGTLGLTASVALSGVQIVGALLNNIAIEMSDITTEKTKQEIATKVETVYISILAMEETVDLLNMNLGNLKHLYEVTQKSVEIGVSEQINADQISVQVSSMQSTINSTLRSLEILYNSLRLQLGLGVDCGIVLTQKMNELLNVETSMELLKTEFDFSKNHDYRLLQQNSRLAKQQITMTAMEYLPTFRAFYQYSNKTYFGKSEGFNMTPPNMVGVSVSLPIWSSGKRASAVTEKKLAYKTAQNTLEDTSDALKVQDKQLRYNLASAFENYDIQKANIEVSRRVFENISHKYEQGLSSSLDLTNSSTNLILAQRNYVSALLEMVNAQIALKKLLNKY